MTLEHAMAIIAVTVGSVVLLRRLADWLAS